MSPNKNYLAGRRFEYDRMKHYKEVLKLDAVRTAGSHGKWDIIATDWPRGIVTHIQCKVVSDLQSATRYLQRFRDSPPYSPQRHCHQRLEVKVKGSTEVHSVTV